MEYYILARVIHVLSIVLWIGGVAMVTLVLLPAVREFSSPEARVAFFEKVERRFATQSRITTVLAGASGFYMVYAAELWPRFGLMSYGWMHGMVFVWLVFTLMLFVMEPLFLHRWFHERAEKEPEATFRFILRMHRILLTLSLIVVGAAVAGSHGWI
ncbi:MAG: hypothetical protein H7A00_02845 [Hahellaceae bacterium]|nr:hypothetical protein [Hahellaceae bacterium]